MCAFNFIFFVPCKKHLLLHPALLNALLKGLTLSLPLELGLERHRGVEIYCGSRELSSGPEKGFFYCFVLSTDASPPLMPSTRLITTAWALAHVILLQDAPMATWLATPLTPHPSSLNPSPAPATPGLWQVTCRPVGSGWQSRWRARAGKQGENKAEGVPPASLLRSCCGLTVSLVRGPCPRPKLSVTLSPLLPLISSGPRVMTAPRFAGPRVLHPP